MSNLTFDALAVALKARDGKLQNGKGELGVPGSQRSPSYWGNAMAGETGEACNLMKKLDRGDFTLDDKIIDNHTKQWVSVREAIAKELADVVTYAALFAEHNEIDLGKAVELKFNEISNRGNAPVFFDDGEPYVDVLTNDGPVRRYL